MKKRKLKKVVLITSILLVISGSALGVYYGFFQKEKKEKTKEPAVPVFKEEKKLQIVDLNSNSRTYAIMINNHKAARPLSGLKDAYIIYEIIVEGGITRMMALFKDADAAKIGSVRSSRHYYLDYVLENDAIYLHWGGSPQAYSDIKTLKINNIDAVSSVFWKDRSLNRATEHTAFTSIEKINAYVKSKGYRNTTEKDLLLNYSVDPIILKDKENTIPANDISIKYSEYQTTSYTYDPVNKVYNRFMSGNADTDLVTKEQYTAKNIIVYDVKNYTIDSSKNRQTIENIGTGEGYYITDGYATKITWSKASRSSQTVYKYLDGKEITVNDGNTYIQIYPTSGNLTIN